jgi:hypothetical protein
MARRGKHALPKAPSDARAPGAPTDPHEILRIHEEVQAAEQVERDRLIAERHKR